MCITPWASTNAASIKLPYWLMVKLYPNEGSLSSRKGREIVWSISHRKALTYPRAHDISTRSFASLAPFIFPQSILTSRYWTFNYIERAYIWLNIQLFGDEGSPLPPYPQGYPLVWLWIGRVSRRLDDSRHTTWPGHFYFRAPVHIYISTFWFRVILLLNCVVGVEVCPILV